MQPTTSIIIATHNRERLVPRAIESAIEFGPPHSEVIVVNDGSKDRTSDVLGGYGSQIRAINLPQAGGRSAARNLGIQNAAGRFVTFLDDDDWFLPGSLLALETALQSSGPSEVMAYGRPEYVSLDSDGQVEVLDRNLPGMGLHGQVVSALIVQNFIQLGTGMVKRESAVKVGGFRRSSEPSEDWAFWFTLSTIGHILFVDRPISRILRHEGNTNEELFFSGKLDLLLSDVVRSLIQDCRDKNDQRTLDAISSVLLRFAAGSQHRANFGIARQLMQLYRLCGKPFPLFTKEQLWRSWLPTRVLR